MKYRILIDSEQCKGCALCVRFCKQGHLNISREINAKGYHYAEAGNDPETTCSGCMQCAVICPDAVIEIESIEDDQ